MYLTIKEAAEYLSLTEEAVQSLLNETGLKFKVLAQPMRVALTGKTVSPGIFEVLATLGRDRAIPRLKRALSYME